MSKPRPQLQTAFNGTAALIPRATARKADGKTVFDRDHELDRLRKLIADNERITAAARALMPLLQGKRLAKMKAQEANLLSVLAGLRAWEKKFAQAPPGCLVEFVPTGGHVDG